MHSGRPAPVVHNYDGVRAIVAERVAKTQGRITAKRLLPIATAEGYEGSARNFRRLVAEAKATWRVDHHRGRRPGVWAPGDILAFDWGEIGPLFVFCAVLAWSRWRFVFFADNLGSDATLAALAACFEELGGVPATALTDRMGCLKGGTVAGVMVPTADYVRFATHYGFRPDFCEGQDPESKGLVENLVGYVKSDLMIPAELTVTDLAAANTAGRLWCVEVNDCSPFGDRCGPRRASARPRARCWVRCRRCEPRSASSCCARSTGSAASGSGPPATRSRPATSANRSRSASSTAWSRLSCWEPRSPSIQLFPLVRPRLTTTTTAGPDPHPDGPFVPRQRRRSRSVALARPLRRSSKPPPRPGSRRWLVTLMSSPASKPPTDATP